MSPVSLDTVFMRDTSMTSPVPSSSRRSCGLRSGGGGHSMVTGEADAALDVEALAQ